MKLVTYQAGGGNRAGFIHDDKVIDLANAAKSVGYDLPSTVLEILQMGESGLSLASKVAVAVAGKTDPFVVGMFEGATNKTSESTFGALRFGLLNESINLDMQLRAEQEDTKWR